MFVLILLCAICIVYSNALLISYVHHSRETRHNLDLTRGPDTLIQRLNGRSVLRAKHDDRHVNSFLPITANALEGHYKACTSSSPIIDLSTCAANANGEHSLPQLTSLRFMEPALSVDATVKNEASIKRRKSIS